MDVDMDMPFAEFAEKHLKSPESSKPAVDRRVSLRWSKEVPTEQGWYWWWDGDGLPVPVSIMKSGTDGRCFASAGQLGWNRHQYVEDMGGQWIPLVEPETPES